jgi:siroheme synthase (precorrin-2 oxidase/ferrochelatase)
MTDAELDAARDRLAALTVEADGLWEAKQAAADAWYAVARARDELKDTVEREQARRRWEAEFAQEQALRDATAERLADRVAAQRNPQGAA